MCDSEFFIYISGSDRDSDESLECRLREVWIRGIVCRGHKSRREEEEIFFLVPDELFWIPQNISTRSHISDHK